MMGERRLPGNRFLQNNALLTTISRGRQGLGIVVIVLLLRLLSFLPLLPGWFPRERIFQHGALQHGATGKVKHEESFG